MAVLITGATGFLGSAVLKHFHDLGLPVAGTSRRPRLDLICVGEITGSTDWRPALRGVHTIIHCAGLAHVKAATADFQRVNVDGTLNLARQAAEVGASRLIFISSIGVNGDETNGPAFTAKDPPRPHKPYAISKRRAEEGLKLISEQTGLELVIIRPPLIVGAGGKGNVALLAKIARMRLPTPFGLTKNRRDVVSLPTLCQLVEACVAAPVAGQIFLVSDGSPISTRQLIDRVAEDHGLRKLRHLPVPLWMVGGLLTMAGLHQSRSQLLGNLEVKKEIARTPAQNILT